MRRAFTLVELLIALGIMALLVGILLPALTAVRRSADRTACAANLRDIGGQFQMYLNDSRSRLPRVNTMPSLSPPLNDAPSIVQVLEPYHRGATGVFRCRQDAILAAADGVPQGHDTYFVREGSSYQYNPFTAALFAGQNIAELKNHRGGRLDQTPLMFDYEPFHGAAGTRGSCNYLFADFHVGDLN